MELRDQEYPDAWSFQGRIVKTIKTSGDVQEFLFSLQLSADGCMHVRKLPKNHLEIIRGLPRAPLVPTGQSEKKRVINRIPDTLLEELCIRRR